MTMINIYDTNAINCTVKRVIEVELKCSSGLPYPFHEQISTLFNTSKSKRVV